MANFKFVIGLDGTLDKQQETSIRKSRAVRHLKKLKMKGYPNAILYRLFNNGKHETIDPIHSAPSKLGLDTDPARQYIGSP